MVQSWAGIFESLYFADILVGQTILFVLNQTELSFQANYSLTKSKCFQPWID